jgi:hypothetical protein
MAKKVSKSSKKAVKKAVAKNGSKRREWTAADEKTLAQLAKKKTPAKDIAAALNRSTGATRQKAFTLGLSLNAR